MQDLLPDLLLLFHLLCVIVWLGCDFVVFFLSLSLLNRRLPAVVRADRAHVAEVIDKYVLYSYLLTMPVGLALAYWRGWWPVWAKWLAAQGGKTVPAPKGYGDGGKRFKVIEPAPGRYVKAKA